MQVVIVFLLVVGCAGYALWTLMPAALRRPLATALLGWPLPARLRRTMQAAVRPGSGCGCDGCDHAAKPAAAAPQPIHFHPRSQR